MNMKKLSFIFLLTLLAAGAEAQDLESKDVPSIVKVKLFSMYPKLDQEDIDWSLENGCYQAELDVNDMDVSVTFSPKGAVLEKKVELNPTDLPKPAGDYLSKTFPQKPLGDIFKVNDSKNTTTYLVTMDNDELIFDSAGKYLKTKEKEKVKSEK